MAEEEMRWLVGAHGSPKATTGKPVDMGGLPHELGSTGFGVAQAAKVALEFKGIDVKGATVAIEGFGNVGSFAFKFLSEMGVRVVAVSDSRGVIYNEEGLDYEKLLSVKKEKGSVVNYEEGEILEGEKIFGLSVDVLIPAALPDVIHEKNCVAELKAKIIVEGANISVTAKCVDILHERGVLIVPDFVANAGGVISSYVEHIGGTEEDMFKMVEERITNSVRTMLERAGENNEDPRKVAEKIALERLEE
jgi:glutamate dehydrogenase/leucine dehydrogenase